MDDGFFVDWDGKVRRTAAPGTGLTCSVDGAKVDVLDHDHTVTFEATFYGDIDSILAVAPTADLSLVE